MDTATNAKELKKTKIIYWIFTSLFALMDGLVPLLSAFLAPKVISDSMHHLGFPNYFGMELTIGKVIGGMLLIIPSVPPRLKEWAYVGYGISLISAFIADYSVDGFKEASAVFLGVFILLMSYGYYHKMLRLQGKPVF